MQLRALVIAALLALTTGRVAADEGRRVALAPLSTLGSEAKAKETAAIEDALVASIDAIPDLVAVPAKQLRRAIRKAKRSELKVCDGDVPCLAELGGLVDAELVVYGELGGLGDAQVLALKLVDTASRREVRSTTAQFGGERGLDAALRGASYRLLAPGLYKGTLTLKVDIEGATIFLDGDKVATSPTPPLAVEVGNHALRVTHPEYRDYVRFVDVAFDQTTAIQVGMKAFPIVEDEMRQRGAGGIAGPIDSGPHGTQPTPWYRRWYTIAGAGAIVFVGSAVLVGMLSDGIDADREEVVGD